MAATPVTFETPTAIIFVEYDPDQLPPKPSNDWTRFVCISDTHSRTFPVPPGDVLLHGGDLTNTGKFLEFKTTLEWIYGLPHPTKIIIAGNHDLTLDAAWYDDNFGRFHVSKHELEPILALLKGPTALAANVVYLQNELYEFRTKENGRLWSVYGSPHSPEFWNWAFNYERGSEADALTEKFPQTDILITHGPPANILDETSQGENAGCESLARRLESLRPRLHLFGHIHEARGAQIHTWPQDDSESFMKQTVFANGANWPPRGAIGRSFGGPGARPIVVDLLDDCSSVNI